jgi:ADP-ribosyl-[dinitrogen reductase] hydrolase
LTPCRYPALALPISPARRAECGLAVPNLEQRAVGAYLGLAIGDAPGATVEFMTPGEIRHHHGVHRQITGGGWLHLRKGQVTDDTEMSLALGRSILANGRVEPLAVAEAFSDWMRAKPIDIGNTVRRGIIHYRASGVPEVPESEHDAGNGGCMRTLPVALLTLGADEQTIRAASRAQAHVTHHNALADAGTECIIQMVHAALLGKGRQAMKALADGLGEAWPQYAYAGRPVDNPSGYIVDTLRTVFQCVLAEEGFEAVLVAVVNRGGDADTTGAIAGMLAGALLGADAIPTRWLRALDPTVRAECEDQALRLVSRLLPGPYGRSLRFAVGC